MDRIAEQSYIDIVPGLQEQARRVSNRFREQFGQEPQWLAAAPGRVNLIGEHTDYNDGFVLPMAIDRYVVMAGAASPGQEFNAFSVDLDEVRSFRADDPGGRKNGDWSNYLRGVIDGCKAAGLWAGPLDVVLQSNVPFGGGLSSSAALEVAMATLLEAASGIMLDSRQKAYIAQKAEHDYAGVPCGIMDQFASALCREDQLMLLDCRSAEPTMVPFSDPDVAVLIINSNVRHELTGGEYAERRAQCETVAQQLGVKALRDVDMLQLEEIRARLDETLFRRAHHVIGENARTVEAAGAFSNGQWIRAGELMSASHVSLRDDFEVSCRELDILVELALGIDVPGGVFGSRMTGGGFGGCTVTLVHGDAVDDIARKVAGDFETRTGIKPAVYVTRPARGAHVLNPGERQ
jgi:galactokinase